MKKLVSCAAVLAALSIANVAMADEGVPEPKAQRGVINFDPFIITGRYQRPLASIEVSRMAPALTIADLRIPLLERIETAIYSTLF